MTDNWMDRYPASGTSAGNAGAAVYLGNVHDDPGAVGSDESDRRSAIEKACVLLAGLCRSGESVLGVSELARRAGITKSTAHRQLAILERVQMVERVDRGYRVGRTVREWAREHLSERQLFLTNALQPFLVELLEITQRTVQLAVLDGTDVVYIGKLFRHDTVTTRARIGARLAARSTAGGKLLLALQQPLVEGGFGGARSMDRPATNLAEHVLSPTEIGDIRMRGIAFDRGGSIADVWCVAMPVFGAARYPTAALSICAPRGSNLLASMACLRQITVRASRHLTHALIDTP